MKYLMLTIVAVVLVLATILSCDTFQGNGTVVGGGNDVSSATVRNWHKPVSVCSLNTETCGMLVVDRYSVETDKMSVTVHLSAQSSMLNMGDLYLTLEGIRSRPNSLGVSATLSGPESRLLWQFAYEIDTLDQSRSWLTERTANNSLLIQISEKNGMTDEVYVQDGKVLALQYHSVLRQVFAGENVGKLTAEVVSELERQEALFDEFYDHSSSLNGNEKGFLTAELVVSAELAKWMNSEIESLSPDSPSAYWRELCNWAAACTTVKCNTLLTNPLCKLCQLAFGVCIFMVVLGGNAI